jgi:uncharacterized membrane protein YeaQ/YmgE (transglycosylase-associated protein family)
MIAFTFFLTFAAVCAIIVDAVAPGVIPRGFHNLVILGIIGSILSVIGGWLGIVLVGDIGPQLAGISLVPTLVGTGLLLFGLNSASGTLGKA